MSMWFLVLLLTDLRLLSSQISTRTSPQSQPLLTGVSHSLHRCCSLLSSENRDNALISCANSSASEGFADMISAVPYHSGSEGPRLAVTLLTRATSEVFSYADYSYFVQAVYASHNGYALLPLVPDSRTADYEFYRKLVPVKEALMGRAMDSDFIVWMDADIIFLDLGMRIEKIAASYPKAHLIISADVSAKVNSGCFIFRNSPWSLQFIDRWLDARSVSKGFFTDQMGFEYLYERISDTDRAKIAILPPDALNSDAPPMGRQLPHNQVLHLAAESAGMRANAFKIAADEVCAAMKEGRAPTHQLGLSREVIRSTAETSYGSEAQRLSQKFTNYNYSDHTEDRPHIIQEITDLRYDMSKHLYAVSYANNEAETPETMQLRRLVSKCISHVAYGVQDHIERTLGVSIRNLTSLPLAQAKAVTRHPDFTNLLNLFKLSCECSYELVHALQVEIYSNTSDTYMEWKELTIDIMYKIDFMLTAVTHQQRFLVLDMKASLLGTIGELLSYVGDINGSISHLERSLEIYNTLRMMNEESGSGGGGGDKRAMLGIKSALAKGLCMNHQYTEAMTLFSATLREEASHVGQYHHNLAQKYINAAVCALTAGLLEQAKPLLQSCLITCEKNSHVPMGDTCTSAAKYWARLEKRCCKILPKVQVAVLE